MRRKQGPILIKGVPVVQENYIPTKGQVNKPEAEQEILEIDVDMHADEPDFRKQLMTFSQDEIINFYKNTLIRKIQVRKDQTS